MIKGGYILQPRAIDESDISLCPPHVREIWLYFLRKANHTDFGKIKRGQLMTSYSQIIRDLSWKVGYRKEGYKRHHCETAMKLLTKLSMITTTKTTRGMIVTILKYDYYQDKKNYENHNETDNETDNETAMKADTIYNIIKNDKNVKKDIFNFRKSIIGLGVQESIADDWLKVRKEKRAANTETAFNLTKKEIEKSGMPANDCIEYAVFKSWQGFKASWLENEINQNGEVKQTNGKGFKSDTTRRTIEGIQQRFEQLGKTNGN